MPAFTAPLVLLVLLLLVSGCGTSTPDDLIDEETYIELLTELHLLAVIHSLKGEVHYRSTQKAIMEYYGVTYEQFERSQSYYMKDFEAERRRMVSVSERLSTLRQEVFQMHQFELDRSNQEARERAAREAGEAAELSAAPEAN